MANMSQLNNSIVETQSRINDLAPQNPGLAAAACNDRINMCKERDAVFIFGIITLVLFILVYYLCDIGGTDNRLFELCRKSGITTGGVFGLISMGILVKHIPDYIKAYKKYKTSAHKFNENNAIIELNKMSLESLRLQLEQCKKSQCSAPCVQLRNNDAVVSVDTKNVTPQPQHSDSVIKMTEQWMREIVR